MSVEPLRVVLCWHMHQPEYRNPLDGRFLAPWTYLHAIKDYVDMAAHVEQAPDGVRAVVNFPPVLLEQLVDYAGRVRACLESGTDPGDELLAALAGAALPEDREQRRALLERCLHAEETHMIGRFAPYARLADMARRALETETGPDYLSDRHLIDLLVWYHLAWLGETVRRGNPEVRGLLEKAADFSLEDRRALTMVIAGLVEGVPGRYAELARLGRVELSASPYTHPMLPLLLDFASAREPRPDLPLPDAPAYPGGAQRAVWQLRQARAFFKTLFDTEPVGCWPSEGGISARTVELIGEQGYQWAASGQTVLRNSLDGQIQPDSNTLHRPYRLGDSGPACFFRDDELSDLIGFTYKDWHADDAVADFVSRLDRIATQGEPGRVVAVILDGENPWEHYPDNGHHFVPALYRALVQSGVLRLTTFSECLADSSVPVASLPRIVAGSWVYGTLDTWIGSPDKNRAWDLLCEAKTAWDKKLPDITDESRRAELERQLAVCEGSDWFWWFGDYNPADVVAEFDRLYRLQLESLYRMLDEPVPAALSNAISQGHGHPELGGTMRRGQE